MEAAVGIVTEVVVVVVTAAEVECERIMIWGKEIDTTMTTSTHDGNGTTRKWIRRVRLYYLWRNGSIMMEVYGSQHAQSTMPPDVSGLMNDADAVMRLAEMDPQVESAIWPKLSPHHAQNSLDSCEPQQQQQSNPARGGEWRILSRRRTSNSPVRPACDGGVADCGSLMARPAGRPAQPQARAVAVVSHHRDECIHPTTA
jgi:hypothetical protein